jgi:hypothetical protein
MQIPGDEELGILNVVLDQEQGIWVLGAGIPRLSSLPVLVRH